jgi:hypothetical protein
MLTVTLTKSVDDERKGTTATKLRGRREERPDDDEKRKKRGKG